MASVINRTGGHLWWAFAGVALTQILVGCAHAPIPQESPDPVPPELQCDLFGSSPNNDEAARIGTLFERPRNGAGLLRNLKLAYDQDLFVQAGFYTDENLKKFFAGTSVEWDKPRSSAYVKSTSQHILITSDDPELTGLIINMSRVCAPEVKSVSPKHFVVDHLSYSGTANLYVNYVAGLTVAEIRAVFGTENSGGPDDGYVCDQFGGPPPDLLPTNMGSLTYFDAEKQRRNDSLTWQSELKFMIPLQPVTGPIFRPSRLNDTDGVERIVNSQLGK